VVGPRHGFREEPDRHELQARRDEEDAERQEWTITDPSGKVSSKSEDLNNLKSGKTKFVSFANEDVKVKIYGKTAIVTGLTMIKGTQDGNDIGGIRSTAVLAPTATYTGWNLYSGVFQDDFCTLSGSYIPFARTFQERTSTGDPRLSLAERYGTHAGYVDAVRKATQKLVNQRLLLQVDADRLIGAADASDILK